MTYDLPVFSTRCVERTSSDGHVLHGQLTVPSGANLGGVPLVVEPHGGPQCADDSSFSPTAQFLASNGYAYFRPDSAAWSGFEHAMTSRIARADSGIRPIRTLWATSAFVSSAFAATS